MKILYWNLWGIANVPTQKALKEFVRAHTPEILCIAEPFVTLVSIPSSFWCTLGMQVICTNDHDSLSPNLWICCKSSLIPWVRVLFCSDQLPSSYV